MTYAKPFKTLRTAALIAMAGMMTATYATSQPRRDQHPHPHEDRKAAEQQAIREAVARGEVIPLPKILVIAQKAVPGDIIDVELEQKEWGLKYELKILTAAGRVRKVDINARTGKVVKIGDD
jgi:uncharacterized membrane protein YkoI